MKNRMIAAFAGAVFLALAVAAPASAAPVADRTLPTAQKLVLLPCEGEAAPGSIYSVDTASGQLTQIGNVTLETSCWSSGYYNPADGLIYAVNWNVMSAEEPKFYYLSSINPTTGVVTQLSTIKLPVDPEDPVDLPLNQYAVTISPAGVVYVADNEFLYTLDVGTGNTELVGKFTDNADGADPVNPTSFYSLAFSPDGTLYGNSWTRKWYTIDPLNAVVTELVTSTGNNAGLTFDSSGVAWFQLDSQFEGNTGFASGTVPNLGGTRANVYQFTIGSGDAAVPVYAESLLVIPATPSGGGSSTGLAKTGADASAVTVASSLGAVMLAAGAVFMVSRRRLS